MQKTPEEIRENVRQHYAERATTSTSCCSGSQLYDIEMMSDLPDDVSGFSLGCGDPITEAKLQPGETVLDLGSGGGLDCLLAAREVGAKGHVIGVDMTPEMLARARKAAERQGAENVEFRQGYLEDLPVEDETVDVVISNCVLNLSPDKLVVFQEMARVLKPGGRISISDIVHSGELPESLRDDMDAWSACAAGALSVEEFSQGLREAGLSEVEIRAKGGAEGLLDEIPEDTLFSAWIGARKPE